MSEKIENGPESTTEVRPRPPVDDSVSTVARPRQVVGLTGRVRDRLASQAPSEPSVTQAIRVRRSAARRAPDFSMPVVPLYVPRRAADAAFPALVSLLFTAPPAVSLWGAGRPGAAAGLMAGVALLVFGFVAGISRWLNGAPPSTD